MASRETARVWRWKRGTAGAFYPCCFFFFYYCTVSMYSDPPPPPFHPRSLTQAQLSWLSCTNRPSVAELWPWRIPPVFPGGWTGWWMEESRPGEPLLYSSLHHLLLLAVFLLTNLIHGEDLFVCLTECIRSSVVFRDTVCHLR